MERGGINNKIILIGRSEKRLQSVIVYKEKTGLYYIVIARDADNNERRLG